MVTVFILVLFKVPHLKSTGTSNSKRSSQADEAEGQPGGAGILFHNLGRKCIAPGGDIE